MMACPVGIFLAVGALILAGVKDQTTAGTNAFNVTEDAESGLVSLGDFQSLIGLVVADFVWEVMETHEPSA